MNNLIFTYMKNNFFNSPDISTNKQLIECIDNLHEQFLKASNNYFTSKILSKYFCLWKGVFNTYKYDNVSDSFYRYLAGDPTMNDSYETYPYHFYFNGFGSIYANFDIEYIKTIKHKLPTIKYSDIKPILDLNSVPDNISDFTDCCLNAGSLIVVQLCGSDKCYKIIDGNHRLYFIEKQHLENFKVSIISFESLEEKMFINKFNYAVYLFFNELNTFPNCNNIFKLYKQYLHCKYLLSSNDLI